MTQRRIKRVPSGYIVEESYEKVIPVHPIDWLFGKRSTVEIKWTGISSEGHATHGWISPYVFKSREDAYVYVLQWAEGKLITHTTELNEKAI